MRIALYIEEGVEQIVLTPESDTERGIIGKLHCADRDLSIKQGSFYECQGGWVRQGKGEDSTFIVLRAKASVFVTLQERTEQLAAERAAYPEVPPHTTKRLIAAVSEGDLVVLTWHLDVPEPEDGANSYVACSFDMFRFDEDGTIVEHWDDVRKGAPH